jgi:hypothetical protein
MPSMALYSRTNLAAHDDDELGFDDSQYLTPTPPPSRTKVLSLISLSSTFLLAFIVLPVVIPDEKTYFSFPRYGLNDLLRTLDPFINFPIIYLIFVSSRPAASMLVSFLFAISTAIYITGSVAHTTSAMFKHSVEEIQNSLAPTTVASVTETYDYIRNVWEHIVGHYLYAGGMLCLLALTIAVHYHATYPALSLFQGWMMVYSATLSGLLYALVATQLPYAPLIGIVIYGGVCAALGFLMWKEGELGLRRWASRPVPQLYFMATGLACVITIVWTAVKGIKGRNLG